MEFEISMRVTPLLAWISKFPCGWPCRLHGFPNSHAGDAAACMDS